MADEFVPDFTLYGQCIVYAFVTFNELFDRRRTTDSTDARQEGG